MEDRKSRNCSISVVYHTFLVGYIECQISKFVVVLFWVVFVNFEVVVWEKRLAEDTNNTAIKWSRRVFPQFGDFGSFGAKILPPLRNLPIPRSKTLILGKTHLASLTTKSYKNSSVFRCIVILVSFLHTSPKQFLYNLKKQKRQICNCSNYVVERRDTRSSTWVPVSSFTTGTEITVPKLHEGHEYEFRVMAENALGRSDPLVTDKPVLVKDPFGIRVVLWTFEVETLKNRFAVYRKRR